MIENRMSSKGFTLVEMLVSLVIFAVVLAGTMGGYIGFQQGTRVAVKQQKLDSDIKLTLKLLQRDLNMAGFGLPRITRVASDDQSVTLTEVVVGFDFNEDDDREDDIVSDRIFMADGWEILKDITDNGEIDGNIVESPTDYYSKIGAKREKGGYKAAPAASVTAGATAVSVDDTNLNLDEEYNTADGDIKSNTAVIIAGDDNSSVFHVEGARVALVAGTAINLVSGESLLNAYTQSSSEVVGGIAWYVDMKTNDAVPWLYRNNDKVVPHALDFQIQYGFDIDRDGLEWASTVPGSGTVDGDSDARAKADSLKSVKITLTALQHDPDQKDVGILKEFTQIVNLKN